MSRVLFLKIITAQQLLTTLILHHIVHENYFTSHISWHIFHNMFIKRRILNITNLHVTSVTKYLSRHIFSITIIRGRSFTTCLSHLIFSYHVCRGKSFALNLLRYIFYDILYTTGLGAHICNFILVYPLTSALQISHRCLLINL